MKKQKIIATAAAIAVGTSVVTSVAPGALAAKTTYKVKSGKLVNAKTGKIVKGYKTYKSVLYKDGKKFTGLRSGKYYKSGVLGTGTYKSIKYKNGKKFTGIGSNKKYYKNGVLGTGTYKSVKYKKGEKFTGISTDKKYYKNGLLGTGTYNDIKYKNGVLFTGVSSNGAEYTNGVLTASKEEVALRAAQNEVVAAKEELTAAQQELADLAAIEAQLNDGVVATTQRLKALAVDPAISKFIQENKGRDFSKLTADEKKAVIAELKGHKEKAVQRYQAAVQQVVQTYAKAVEIAATIAKESTPDKVSAAQQLLEEAKTSVATIVEAAQKVEGVQIDTSAFDQAAKQAEDAVAQNTDKPTDGQEGSNTKPTDPTTPGEGEEKPTEPTKPTDNSTGSTGTGSTGTGSTGTGSTGTDSTGVTQSIEVETVEETTYNGYITVKLKNAVAAIKPSDFTVTQVVDNKTAEKVNVTQAFLKEDGKTVTLILDRVEAKDTIQSVVYTVNNVKAKAISVSIVDVKNVEAKNENGVVAVSANIVNGKDATVKVEILDSENKVVRTINDVQINEGKIATNITGLAAGEYKAKVTASKEVTQPALVSATASYTTASVTLKQEEVISVAENALKNTTVTLKSTDTVDAATVLAEIKNLDVVKDNALVQALNVDSLTLHGTKATITLADNKTVEVTINQTTLEQELAADEVAPEVKEVKVEGKKVTVSFTEDVAYLDGEKVKELVNGAEAKDFFELVGSDYKAVANAIESATYDTEHKTYVIILSNAVADDEYTLTYTTPENYALVDLAGNELKTVSEKVKIDTTAPVVTGVTEGQVAKEVTPVSAAGDIKTVVLTKGTETVANYALGTAVTEAGTYKLTVTDNAGNTTTVNFTIDTTAPTVTSATYKVGETTKEATVDTDKITFAVDQGSKTSEIKLTLSEAVQVPNDTKIIVKSGITVLDENYGEIKVEGDTITITPNNGEAPLAGTFTVEILLPKDEKITDLAGNQLNLPELELEVAVNLKGAIEKAFNYKYEDYAYAGTSKLDQDPTILTNTYKNSSSLTNSENPSVMNDMARFLGALHRQDNGNAITSITFDNKEFTWKEAGELKGSNWIDDSSVTLVSYITSKFQSKAIQLKDLTVDGLKLKLNYDQNTSMNLTLKSDFNDLTAVAEQAVSATETATDAEIASKIVDAQNLVDALSDGDVKTDLTTRLEVVALINTYGDTPLKVVGNDTVKTVKTYLKEAGTDTGKKAVVVDALKAFDIALTAAKDTQLTKDQLTALASKVAAVDAETDLAKAITQDNAAAVAKKVNAAAVKDANSLIAALTKAVGEVQAEADAQAVLEEAAQAGVVLKTNGNTAVEKLASVQQVTKEGLSSDSKFLVVTLVNDKNSQVASSLDNVKAHLESTKHVAINTGNIVLEDKQIEIKGPLVTPDDFKKLKASPESKEAYRITVLNSSDKQQKLVKIAILPSGQAVIEDVTYANLVKAQTAVAALENKTPFELATTDVINKAETAVATVSDTTQKAALTTEIDKAKKSIEEAKTAGTLLNLTTKTAEKSFLTLLVKEGSNQVKATPEAINTALQARYDAIATGELSTVTEYDKEGIAALDKDKAVINFDAIKVSEDGKWIAVEGDFMTTEAFKVAKGKGSYSGQDYKITILTNNALKAPGSNDSYKAAKIVVTANNEGNVSTTTLEEVK